MGSINRVVEGIHASFAQLSALATSAKGTADMALVEAGKAKAEAAKANAKSDNLESRVQALEAARKDAPHAFYYYSQNCRINHALRSGRLSDKERWEVNRIIAALDAQPLMPLDKRVCYRGIDLNGMNVVPIRDMILRGEYSPIGRESGQWIYQPPIPMAIQQ